jgi:DNA-binding response OmpR family regulator/curved DNA-binding protein CbpA
LSEAILRNEAVHALIIDDDRAIQRLLADALAREGFTVTVERDGEWALKTFEQRQVDVVLLDLLLPAINGYEVARRMRALPKGEKTPIIMISGIYKSAVHKKDALERYGATAFLEKPFKLAALRDALKTALGNRYPTPAAEVAPAAPAPAPAPEALADASAREEAKFVEKAALQVPSLQSIRGDIKDKSFAELLAEVHRWSATGALLLRRDKVKKIVYFRNGLPMSVKSNLLSECLGRVMVKERMISEDECEESLKRMKSSGRQQGTVLVEMGCISPHNLNYGLNLQLRTKMLEIFSWQEGEYQFNPKVAPPAETVALDMSTAAVIYEGVKRGYDDGRVAKALGEVGALFVRPSANPLFALQDIGLGEEEQEIMRACDGRKSIADLRKLAAMAPADTDRLIYAMRCAQMIELTAEAIKGTPPPLPRMSREIPKQTLLPDVPAPQAVAAAKAVAAEPRAPVIAQAASPMLPEITDVHDFLPPEDDTHVREHLLAKAAAFKKMDFFGILGVPTTASDDDIARGYFALAGEYHPDKFAGSPSAEVRALANEIYGLLGTAFETLREPKNREAYLGDVNTGEHKREANEEVDRMLAAEAKFKKGQELVKANAFDDAHQLFQAAIELYGQEGEFHAYLGWTQFQRNPEDKANAKASLKVLERAVELNPGLDRTYLFAGQIYKALGKPDRAEKQFEKALECNPSCYEALHELSILSWASRLSKAKL